MSTRAAIARPAGNGRFRGVYHHWDGYPEGLGATLYQLSRDKTLGDAETMLRTLIDAHPAGWSTINGADWSLEPGFTNFDEEPCAECGSPQWMHWVQSYESHGLDKPEPFEPDTYQALDHSFAHDYDRPKRPECYCHGSRSEEGWEVTEENASGSGVEWVYVIDAPSRTMYILSSYIAGGELDGAKMIGMFGCGDPDARWQVVAAVDLDGPEPDWKALMETAYARSDGVSSDA